MVSGTAISRCGRAVGGRRRGRGAAGSGHGTEGASRDRAGDATADRLSGSRAERLAGGAIWRGRGRGRRTVSLLRRIPAIALLGRNLGLSIARLGIRLLVVGRLSIRLLAVSRLLIL